MTQEQEERVSLSDDDAVAGELAKTSDVSEYIAEREEQEERDRPPEDDDDGLKLLTKDLRDKFDLNPDKKKTSRYERLKRARDQYKAEAELPVQAASLADHLSGRLDLP